MLSANLMTAPGGAIPTRQSETGMRKILIPLLTIFLAACNLPLFITDVEPLYPTDTPGTITNTPHTVTKTPQTPTETPTPGTEYTQCAWTWATQSLPDLTTKVQSALEEAGLKGVTVSAEAYGENCIIGTGTVDHFAAMETDFRFQAEVTDLSDKASLGDLLERILVVLDAFPTDATPGPQPGYIGVHFFHETEEINLWFKVTASDSARSKGLHGAELINELLNK
jgi:hypothetical protein